ncbi:MAG: hypothetical protein U1F56_19500 [Rubrivivax sp.]
MSETDDTDIGRRSMLQLAAGLAAAAPAAAGPTPAGPAPTGKAGDFDFLAGEWRIANERLKDGTWDRFEGEATVHRILGGIGSVEELRIPARQFSGMGLRLLDVDKRLWADHWVNARSGVLGDPTWGSFVDGAGHWDSVDDSDRSDGHAAIWRGTWDRITPTGCRWSQSVSRDGGRSWQAVWVMQWRRA